MMSQKTSMQRKEFALLREGLQVRYKFLSKKAGGPLVDEIFEGSTDDINSIGMRMVGRIPEPAWIPDLMMREIYLGINILLPEVEHPVKALGRILWIEAWEDPAQPTGMGIKFRDMEAGDRLRVAEIIARIRRLGSSTRKSPLDA